MKRILIANRGEIACRIIRTAKRMGIETVAVYSDIDRRMPHVFQADFAYPLEGNESKDTYLSMDKIIHACKSMNVDAVHPGYGFLSENAEFAERVENEGITFIGPKPYAINIMGSKLLSKEAVRQYNVPLIPGSEGKIKNVQEGHSIIEKIGFPVMIKASAGGGGKGMRIVHKATELDESINRAQSEARNAFANDEVFIEKYIENPKHIEVQILADMHGGIISVFERECSIQRRHQKIIEEAPSISISEEVRQQICEAARNVARSCGYVGAGTVEFILDENQNFYFLEMNTRLQVEHPVTEMITGIDLVEEQIRIAKGEPLRFDQNEVISRGHAIELRVYAEDSFDGFKPNIGEIQKYSAPQGEGIRVDDAIYSGLKIPIYYDPMLAKLIVHAQTRELAIMKMNFAINNYTIEGVETTLPFGRFAINHPKFRDGSFTTKFVENFFSKEAYIEQNKEFFEVASEFVNFFYAQNQ